MPAPISAPQPAYGTLTESATDVVQRFVQGVFARQDAEDLLLLRLAHLHRLTPGEIARIWGCDETEAAAALVAARSRVAADVSSVLERVCPSLQLKWRDLIELCERSRVTAKAPGRRDRILIARQS